MGNDGKLDNMSIEQIKMIMNVLQKASDAYLFILDLTSEVYIIPEKLTKRVAFESTRIENCMDKIRKVVHPADWDMLNADIEKCVSGEQEIHDLEYRWLDRNGRPFWINCKGTVITDAEGHNLMVGKVNEIGKQEKADNVTGLRKEPRFRLDLETILREEPESIRYCMRIGIDNFKEINEKEGTEAGDEVLWELAKCITEIATEKVSVYRLVADEFMIMDTVSDNNINPNEIYSKIKAKIAQLVKDKDYNRFFTISAGIMDKDFAGKSSNDIMMLSEFALNEAKRNGKNQMAIFIQDDYDGYLKQLDIRKCIRRDISNKFKGFEVYYQPIVDANTHELIGAEALLRWNSDKYGNVSPTVMIPIMEESGLIIPIGSFVLWEAARTCKEWQKIMPNFHVHVNLSYVQVYKSDLMSDVNECIKEVGISPDSLVLELTESGYIETDNRIRELFKNLKDSDISLAIDDFGTGYSNMRYLKEIEAKTIKLDRSFVLQAMNNDYDYTIICHIIDMIHSVGSTVVMEGIEYDYELEKMKNAKPDMIQGYLFGKPATAQEFKEKFLLNK
ncbi:MAG: GGDEF and EAL domain-containing protein [Lachnospiraceae bacterium]|nr:GGDEF and EAL domain-containing protein [Lachnospiraceae bacterium]